MAKNRASFVKRQREMAKKQKREAKIQRKIERKANKGDEGVEVIGESGEFELIDGELVPREPSEGDSAADEPADEAPSELAAAASDR